MNEVCVTKGATKDVQNNKVKEIKTLVTLEDYTSSINIGM
jgi:hypothetical protein